MTILVTGCAGFIGSHLAERLVLEGESVIGLDNFDPFYPREVKVQNLDRLATSSKFQFREGSINDLQNLSEELRRTGVTSIVHLAAKAGVGPSIRDPTGYERTNVQGTLALLEVARRIPDIQVVFASSSSVYGATAMIPFAENGVTDRPISPYAATKKAAELLCHTYSHLYGIPTTCLRLFTVYGPRQRPDLAIHRFARLMSVGKPIPFFGDGTSARDYTYVSDIVAGILAAIRRRKDFATYNLGNSYPIPLTEMVSILSEELGKPAILDRKPMPKWDVPITYADISAAKNDLRYRPQIPFRDGIRRFVEWFKFSWNQSPARE